jgi:hypothetical protein
MVKFFDFLFTEHLTLNRENFPPSSKIKFELQKFELWKKHNMESTGVFSGNMNSLRVMENSIYRSSTVFKSGGLHEKHAVATWNSGATKEFALKLRKTKKTYVDTDGRSTLRVHRPNY